MTRFNNLIYVFLRKNMFCIGHEKKCLYLQKELFLLANCGTVPDLRKAAGKAKAKSENGSRSGSADGQYKIMHFKVKLSTS